MDPSGSISGILNPHLLVVIYSIVHVPSSGVMASAFVMLLLIMCSAVMAASEIAFFSISAAELDELKESEERSDQRLVKLLERPKYLLSTILIGNNLINIGVIVISYFIITNVFSFEDVDLGFFVLPKGVFDFIVNVIIVTFFLVLFGEAIPKVYATHNKLPIARSVSGLFTFLNKFLSPVNYLLVNSTAVIEKRIKRHNAEIDIDEINKAIDITVDNKSSKNDVKMLKGIVHFGNITVRQVMRPRMDVAAADVEWDFLKLISFVKENGYSRLPVFKESIDNIQGVLYIKDLLEHIHQGKDFQWQKLIREALHTPETKKIDDLLREFQETRKHLAIVVDEFGGTSGIVTLEDIVEEVIGDINDESDESADSQLRKNPDGSYIVEGIMQLGDLAKGLELENDYFEEAKGDAETVGGLVVELFGRIPKVGEEVALHHFKFKVLSFKKNRIEKLKIFNNTPQS